MNHRLSFDGKWQTNAWSSRETTLARPNVSYLNIAIRLQIMMPRPTQTVAIEIEESPGTLIEVDSCHVYPALKAAA
ncbi:MAG: hypothetical protein WDN02_08740 [Methylovirgula sp.]|uniref:hypothetical protein n=1 Tax=Methylovirgula sp. TaxID=1978224 RepID=UPI003075FA7F